MKIIKIRHCYEKCQYYDFFYDTNLNLDRHICKNPEATKYSSYRIINKKIINQDKIPDWCPLEDYKSANN